MAYALVCCQDGFVPIRLLNYTEDLLTLPRHAVIGHVCEAAAASGVLTSDIHTEMVEEEAD